MEARRRTLMTEGPLGNALPHSSIPVPSSVMKKPAARTLGSSRMSMAPSQPQVPLQTAQNPMRLSTMPSSGNLAGNTGISHSNSQEGLQRRSTLAPNRGDQGPMSGNRGDGGMYGRTPQTMRSIPSRLALRDNIHIFPR